MKQYKLTYPVNLKPSSGFCTTPFEIMRQMDEARRVATRELRSFLKREGLEDQVKAVVPVPHQIGLMLLCTDDVATRLKSENFVSAIEEDKTQYLPPRFKL